jgi:hypothetical protein
LNQCIPEAASQVTPHPYVRVITGYLDSFDPHFDKLTRLRRQATPIALSGPFFEDQLPIP